MTYKEIKKARTSAIKQASVLTFGKGLKGIITKILRNRFSVIFGSVGLLIFIFGLIGKNMPDIYLAAIGIAIIVLSVLKPFFGFLVSAMSGFLVFAAYPFIMQIFYPEDIDQLLEYVSMFGMLVILLITSVLFRKKYISRPMFSILKREKTSDYIIIDPILAELYPIEGYFKLLKLTYTLSNSKQIDMNIFAKQFMQTAKRCNKCQCLLSGGLIKEKESAGIFYVYASNESDIKRIEAFGNKDILESFSEIIEDNDWQQFKNDIIPDDLTLQLDYNKKFISTLERHGADLSEMKDLVYIIGFENETNAKECFEKAESNGFSPLKTEGEEVRHDTSSFKDMYIISLKLKSRLGLERLNMNSANVIDYVRNFNGSLKQWFISKVKEV